MEPTTPTDSTRIGDEAVQKATGLGWQAWIDILAPKVKPGASHAEIVRTAHDCAKISPWWAQTIAGHYERECRGRATHEMKDGFQATASKTMTATPMTIFETLISGEADWFPGGAIEASTINPPTDQTPNAVLSVLRGKWTGPDGGRIAITLTPKSEGKTMIAINHEHLATAAICEARKCDWRTALSTLKDSLENG
ncbi:MAG: hypothetical protein AAGK25_02225 [Pseudomonadota bacterium]